MLEDHEINGALLLSKGVTASNVGAAGLGPLALHEMGVEDPEALRRLGYTAMHLTDAKIASEASTAYGGRRVVEAFLVGASDAVALAGSEAVSILGVEMEDMLQACAGAPKEAGAVLEQMPQGVSLKGVSARTLLDTGLRKGKLMEYGYSLAAVVKQTKAGPTELSKLGFGL